MGWGDEIMCSGIARGAKAHGKRIAFGDRVKIRWHPYAKEIFRNNPNVVPPGSENDPDIEWCESYAGKRPYNRQFGDRWLWIPGHANRPGEVFFDDAELQFASKQGSDFVVVEPNVPAFKMVVVNKQWAPHRFDEVVRSLAHSREVVQFTYGAPHGPGHTMPGVRKIAAPSFRHALAVMARAALYIGPEGGLHHGAAAVGTPAVVIFGGFISPGITGYDSHENLFTGGDACGSLKPCPHCRKALDAVTVDMVLAAAARQLTAVAA